MNLSLVSALILVGLLNCLVMIFLIIRNRNIEQIQNKLLLSLLCVLGLSLIPTFLGHLGIIARYDNLKFIPLNLVLFVFPILFLYYKSLFKEEYSFDKQSIIHFIVPLLFWVYFFVVWVGSMFFAPDEKVHWVASFGYFEMKFAHNIILLCMVFGYSLFSYTELQRKKAELPKKHIKYVKWYSYLIIFMSIGVSFDLISTILGQVYGYWKSSPLDDFLGFSLTMAVKVYNAILLYIISLVGYLSYTDFKLIKNIDALGIERQLHEMLAIMKSERPYLSSDFSMNTLAKRLNITPVSLSNLLNNHLNVSFTDFSNRHRVEEVKRRIKSSDFDHMTLVAIAKDSGFRSKTTFYRAFQKFTALTPKEYLNRVNQSKKVS